MTEADNRRQPSVAGAAIGAGAGLLGSLLTIQSQKDLLNRKIKDRNAAEAAARQASSDIQRGVLGAAATSGGGLGLHQGLRQTDRLQRSALSGVQQARLADTGRQDAFDKEQRLREEKLGAGIGGALGAAGATLGTAFTQGGDPAEAAVGQGAVAGGVAGSQQAISAPRDLSLANPTLDGGELTAAPAQPVIRDLAAANPALNAAPAPGIAAELLGQPSVPEQGRQAALTAGGQVSVGVNSPALDSLIANGRMTPEMLEQFRGSFSEEQISQAQGNPQLLAAMVQQMQSAQGA